MRRIVCFLLTVFLITQTTGVPAFAASLDDRAGSTAFAQFQTEFADIMAIVPASNVIALLTGSSNHWTRMNPPARVTSPRVDPGKTRLREMIRPAANGTGILGNPPPLPAVPMLPKDAAKLHTSAASEAQSTSRSQVSRLYRLPTPTIRNSAAAAAAAPGRIRAPGRALLDVTVGGQNITGFNPWWSYEAGPLPGTGKYMVNVANGNLLVQSTDIEIPERGINLVFQRTYNSNSLNDTNASSGNDDGSPNENVYGNGWTNTFDAHLANNSSGGITVFDIDGSRYDYSPNGSGCLTPPAGIYSALCVNGTNAYSWTKKTGVVYSFERPDLSGSVAAYAGRLVAILGRNHNNALSFAYYWQNGDSSSNANLSQITITHTDGQQLVLSFGPVNGRILLSSITRPGGAQVVYTYSGAHDLVGVAKIGNGTVSPLQEDYGYYDADKLAWTSNPRWNNSGGSEGSFTNFYYDGNGRINGVLLYGFANFTPDDTTNTLLQSNYTSGGNTIAYSVFGYPSSGETTLGDVDGHARNWFYDSTGRVTDVQFWTGTLTLETHAAWDSANNLTETTDARGNSTDYSYDNNGNSVAVALPAVTTNDGAFRPTTLYSYDRTNGANNIVASCDPIKTHSIGGDWVGNPGSSDTLCPSTLGASHYAWDYSDGSEPFGRLQQAWTPGNYHRSYAYNSSAETGDYGLISDVYGDCITENDGNSRCPHKTLSYDSLGNLVSSNAGNGAWSAAYDGLNRMTTVADPDGYTNYTYYYDNGQISKTETPYQHARAVGPTFSYDADGNLTQAVSYHAGSYVNQSLPILPSAPSTTRKFYDGVDRLVEVWQPRDSTGHGEAYTNPWITRYIYDLSQNASLPRPTIGAQSLIGYGQLVETQELLPTSDVTTLAYNATVANGSYKAMAGNSFDAVNRAVSRYSFVTLDGSHNTLESKAATYDSNNQIASNLAGELSQQCSALSQCVYYDYDARHNIRQTNNTSSSDQNKSFVYDPDGRIVSVTETAYGAHTYSYNADGHITRSSEPTGGGVTSPATLTYHYYGDGQVVT